MKTAFSRFIFTMLASVVLSLPLVADPASDALGRMKERLSEIDNLKLAGQVGENAKGFLEARENLGPRQTAMVNAENADRKVVYDSVAQRTGQSSEEVGAQRALQIATRANSGVWLQRPGGEWFQKP